MIRLRELQVADLETLFEYEQEQEGSFMAAFAAAKPPSREDFFAHWQKRMENENILNRVILLDEQIVGSMACFEMFEQRNVGYRLGQAYWGKGIASQALAAFLKEIPERPLYGRCVKDNLGSRRVLEKSGFKLIAEERAFADARGTEVDELILKLE